MTLIAIERLTLADAHELAPLIAAYAQDRKRGAPREADQFYAELLLNDRAAEILGARLDDKLIGFALFFDLPDALTGLRIGQLDELFVIQSERGKSVGRTLVKALAAEGQKRGWTHVRWMAPDKPVGSHRLAERLAGPGSWTSYVIPIERDGGA